MRVHVPGSKVSLTGRAPTIIRAPSTEALLWKASVVAAGGTVSDARLGLVSTLIGSLKTAGVWGLLDRLWLLAAENSQSALIDLVARAFATAINSPTFTADRGYAGNGSTSYLKSGFTPSVNGIAYQRNSAAAFTYQNTTRTASTSDSLGVSDAGGVQTVISPRFTGDIAGGNVNNTAAAGSATGAVTDALGLITMSRTSSTALAVYKRTVQLGTASVTSSPVPSAEIYLLGVNGNGTPTQLDTVRVAAVGLGAGFVQQNVTDLNAALEGGYLTAIGGNA